MDLPEPLNPTQLRACLAACDNHRRETRDKLLVLLSHMAGLRVQEIAAARRRWVMSDNGEIGHHIRVEGRWARVIPMTAQLRNAVIALVGMIPGDPDHPLILSERAHHGTDEGLAPMRPKSITNFFWKLYDEVGLSFSGKSGRQSFIRANGRKLRTVGANVADLRNLAGLKRVEHYLDADAEAQQRLIDHYAKGLPLEKDALPRSDE